MDEHVYQTTELTGSSRNSMEDAIQNAIGKASKTVPNMRWFEVVGTRGYIERNEVAYWQVSLKIGSTMED